MMFQAFRRPAFLFLGLGVMVLGLGARFPGDEKPAPELGAGPLPPPPRAGKCSLVEALWNRRSTRAFDRRPVSREELAFLLWAAGGVNRPEEKRRTTPAAWGAYAVSIYIATADGALVYDPLKHSLEKVEAAAGKDLRGQVAGAEFTRAAPAVLVLVADFARYEDKGTPEMRREIAHADCGVMAQAIYLAAAASGLGTVITADVRLESKEALGLRADQKALYTMPVGHPKETVEGVK
jgi:nitroreductase